MQSVNPWEYRMKYVRWSRVMRVSKLGRERTTFAPGEAAFTQQEGFNAGKTPRGGYIKRVACVS